MSVATQDEQQNSEDDVLQKKDVFNIFKDFLVKDRTPKVGIECEKIGIMVKTGEPTSYLGNSGYLAVLGKLYEELGWEIVKQEGKFILQMKRGDETLDLESDGRIELAGSPHESIHDLAREFRIHQNEISEMANIFGIGWLGIGYHPLSKNEEIENVPQARKELLADFFEKIKEDTDNDYPLAWYKKTAGIHVSLDYFSEEDFSRKAKVFTKLAPVLNAIFANSPFSRGKFTAYMGYRYNVFVNSGLKQFDVPKELYESDFSIKDWVDHLFSLPLLFIERNGEWIEPKMSFLEFLENGFEGYEAQMKDFDLHTKTAWKDVKMKEVVELRCFDSLPPSLVPSVAALIKGIAYDEGNMNFLENLTSKWSYEEYRQLQQDVAKDALHAKFKGEKVLELAKDLIELAEAGLKKNPILDAYDHDETYHLQAIKEYVFVKEKSPARDLVDKWENEWGKTFFPVFKFCQY